MSTTPSAVPNFDNLPPVEGQPQGCAWGVFDRDGKKDLLGTLNFLTPGIVAAAGKQIRDGVSISLNWPINSTAKLGIPGRQQPIHKPIFLPDAMGEAVGTGFDDEISFNTQCSSQWDSLCHFQHQPSGLAYNGFRPSVEQLSGTEQDLPTLEHWHSRGGLVARGVLLDWKSYTEDKAISFHAFDGTRVSVQNILDCAAHQKVQFQHGDVLIVRTGTTDIIDALDPEQITGMMPAAPSFAGVEGSEATARWLWDQRFAAVASDSFAFESFPPQKPDGSTGAMSDLVLHQYLLSGFGMPIGELWDLSRLPNTARRRADTSLC